MIDSTRIVNAHWERAAVSAYLDAAAWADIPEDEPDFDGASWSKQANETATRIVAQFVDRCTERNIDLSALDASQCGHDLWLTRMRHCFGFWDRNMGELGEQLTEVAHTFSEHVYLYAENGELFFHEPA